MPRNGGASAAETPRSKPQSPLRITHDGEFYARLLSKETSSSNPSFRYYGAGPGAVPFVWESHPGTPKDAYSASAAAVVPAAITPPPSYHLRAGGAHGGRRHGPPSRRRGKYRWIKVGFIATVFRRLAFFGGKQATTKSSSSSSPAAASAKSSSTRWLFSGAAEARDDLREYHEPSPALASKAHPSMLCLRVRPSPWMLQFWGGGRREPAAAGWVYGWRRP